MSGSAASVLVADKNPEVRKLLRELAESRGLEVLEAADGPRAERLAQEHPVRLAFVDLLLAGIDGYTVTERIAGRGGPPVLLLAGAFEPIDEQRALEAGAAEILVKPLTERDVVLALERHLGPLAGAPFDLPPVPTGDDAAAGPLPIGDTGPPEPPVALPGDAGFGSGTAAASSLLERLVRDAVRREIDRRVPAIVRRLLREERRSQGVPGGRPHPGDDPPWP